MKKTSCILLSFLLSLSSLCCQEMNYSPWGIWNSYPVNIQDNIRKISYGEFYESGDSGLWILENATEHVPGKINGPAFTLTGTVVRIEKMETVVNGYIFSLVGEGDKQDPKTKITTWKKNTRIKTRMEFISENECRFIIEQKDPQGFVLLCMPEENIIYRRLKVASTIKHNPSPK